jgi:uncharacterized membrane protein YqaE (UPF0057 family)
MVLKRGTITVINIFFPPLGVALLCGLDYDLFINSMLFLCAIIPGHIHAFYISFTYFSRKRKVRKGKYPGDRRPMIYCERVQNGGASRREVEELREQMLIEKEMKREGMLSKTGSRMSRRNSGNGRDSGYVTAAQSPTSPASGQSQWTRPEGRESGSATPQHAPTSYANRMGRRSQRRSGYDEEPEMGEYGRGNGSTRRSQRF